ncbi:DNA-binding transcriptional LysR family regulator [Anaerosolibacter carboniphilus]|uniref:DNA-binding transcriptional LysR family regulator n=1 Tax=Anaerosolibacter carboniphilus TaxID=1417629 RepID=A0A841KPS5_9FIRM|nr:LysR family transcriptional regulator [Anaerosolibacter carboniphilus]MBB6214098.1 DNA-binding transcriptional LysR family regulator [Anaerosolibacter carboniphilus]
MDLHYLKLFHIVATNLSFSKTATQLHISQPAISMQIKKLEDDLGMPLFDRLGRHIYLNDHGKLLYEYTNKIFHLIEEAENKMQEMEDNIWGSLFIGCSNASAIFIMPEIISQYKSLYSRVSINLQLGNTYEIHNLMKLNQIDFAIIGGAVAEHPNIRYHKVWEDRVVLVASPENSLANSNAPNRDQLLEQNIITHDYQSKLYEFAELIYKDLSLHFQPSMLIGSVETIKYLVEANHGIAILPYIAVKQELKDGRLKEIKLKDKCWKYDYHMIYHKSKETVPSMIKLIHLVEKYFEENKERLTYNE